MAVPAADDDNDTYQDDDNKHQKYADRDSHNDYQRCIYTQYMWKVRAISMWETDQKILKRTEDSLIL